MAMRVRRAILGHCRIEQPMRDLSAVCDAARVSVREAPLSGERGGQEALLTPLGDDRFAVVVDATPVGGWPSIDGRMREELIRHRTRFRVAHELAHTLFYWRHGDRPQRHLLDSASQERFCDDFSRALLVPPSLVERLPANTRTIMEIQEAFDVSLEVAVRSVAAAHPKAFIGLWFADSEKDEQVRLQWSSAEKYTARRDAYLRTSAMFAGCTWLSERRQLLVCRH
jgi:IrrE N-terminal-like domain